MLEYTALSLLAFGLSLYYALAVRKLDKKSLLLVCIISIVFQLIFDNIMTALGLWIFDFSYTIGLKIPMIPLENLVFGISLTIATVASWERMSQGKN